MGHFTDNIGIEPAGGKLWRVNNAFSYVTDQGDVIDILLDFIFDGASIPRIAWILIGHPLSQEFLAPSAVHDKLCQTHRFKPAKTHHIFKQAMRDNLVAWWKRTVMWSAVRLFGWQSWNDWKDKK